MSGIEAFLEMGGYGRFVWPAYLLTAAVMLGFLVTTLSTLRERRRELERLEARHPGRQRRREREAAGSGREDPAS
jgi:heme exporter protein D